jgi:hypothetical protein
MQEGDQVTSINLPIEERWKRLRQKLDGLKVAAQLRNPAVTCQIGHYATAAMPFASYASFGKRDRIDEDLVFSLVCRRRTGIIVATSDWARGDGLVLRDGPGATFTTRPDGNFPDPEVMIWLDSVEQFVEDSRDLFFEEMER